MPPRIAVVSFPGNNCEVESMRVIKEAGMEALYFKWNDDRAKLQGVDGYFLVGGFAYEDRGRSGMVAARDPLMDFIGQEAAAGKVVIGNCNGAQVLVESGLIPLGKGLQMSLARNAVSGHATGFLSEWIWMKPVVARNRCASSDWEQPMHMPIAHGEGRFTTKDKDLIAELKKSNQIAFQYCDVQGKIDATETVTPNGSEFSIAGICNQAGNVVAIMPHPERTPNGAPYFASIKKWIENHDKNQSTSLGAASRKSDITLKQRSPKNVEVFIDTIITNNEERTVEQVAKKYAPKLRLKQLKYFSVDDPMKILTDLTVFNANKERAYIRRNQAFSHWNAQTKTEEQANSILSGISLLRRDEPDTGSLGLGSGAQSGVCYVCSEIGDTDLKPELLEVFYNPHAGTLERLTV